MNSPSPKQTRLTVLDGIAVLVGVVVGIGIFGFPPLVAMNVDSETMYVAVWLLGGVIMLIGALCYAELGSMYPSAGGEYVYLTRAYGPRVGMLFAWARGTVIQTGAIAAVAFIYGEYANNIVPLGDHGVNIHAVLSVVILTALNVIGTRESKSAQVVFTILAIMGVLALSIAGFVGPAGAGAPASAETASAPMGLGALGMAMVFVLLTYGGWNETAYISGEMRDVRRDLKRVLIYGTLIVTALYLIANLAFLHIFGLAGLRNTPAVGARLMEIVAGPQSAFFLSLLVCFTALSTINGTILTGARIYYALGSDVPALSKLGAWASRGSTPVNALLLQCVITLALIAYGAYTDGSGISTMVAYTAPVFWLFMLLVALSVIVFRRRHPNADRPFRVPLYPVTPLLFAATCLGLVYSSLSYAGSGAVVGVLVLLVGLPFVLVWGRDTAPADVRP